MQSVSKIKHLHITPRKCRLIADLIRNEEVVKAEAELMNLNKKAAAPILKLLKNATASAENNKEMVKENLYIKEIYVDEGTTMKRWKPRAFGRAYPIHKTTSHITLILDERVKGKRKKQSKAKQAKVENKEKKTDKETKKKSNFDKKELNKDVNKGSDKNILKKIFRRKSV